MTTRHLGSWTASESTSDLKIEFELRGRYLYMRCPVTYQWRKFIEEPKGYKDSVKLIQALGYTQEQTEEPSR